MPGDSARGFLKQNAEQDKIGSEKDEERGDHHEDEEFPHEVKALQKVPSHSEEGKRSGPSHRLYRAPRDFSIDGVLALHET
jgi:hypothetical protein